MDPRDVSVKRRCRLLGTAVHLPTLLGAVIAVGASQAASAQSLYQPTAISTLGGATSVATDINSAGQVVGNALNAAGQTHGFLWAHGALTDLGTLGGTTSHAAAINENGQIAGSSGTAASGDRAYRWSNGVMIGLNTLGGADAYGFDLDDAGEVVGGSLTQGNQQYHAFKSSATGTAVNDLGSLGLSIEAQGNNNAGVTVGYSTVSNSAESAFRHQAGAMTSIGTLGGHYSYAWGVNNGGTIVGASFDDAADTIFRPFRWSAGTMTELPLPSGYWAGVANAITDSGLIVGRAEGANGARVATMWFADTVLNLNDWLPADSGWQLLEATGRNESGQIDGAGMVNGVKRGFVLTLAGRLWTRTTSGDYGTATNWTAPGVPSSSDAAFFVSNGAYDVTFAGNATVASVNVQRGQPTFELAGHSWQVGGSLSVSASAAATFRSGSVSAGAITNAGRTATSTTTAPWASPTL